MASDTSRHDPALAALANYESKRAATDLALKIYENAAELDDIHAAEEQFSNANTAAFLARDAAFKTSPTTTAGALALLRIIGPAISELGHDPDHQPTLANAIGAAVTILEQGGAAMKSSTTRRTILAGLAAAPVAGLPAPAGALPGADPVLAALSAHGRAQAALDAGYARTSILSRKAEAARETLGLVTYKGEEVLTLRQLEHLRSLEPRGLSDDDLERTVADMRRNNAVIRAALVEPDPEYEAARSALVERGQPFEAALCEEREAESADDELLDTCSDAERAIFEVEPTTRAGAAALLLFIADNFDDLIDDSREAAPDAIRAAVVVLEREARA